MLAIIVNIEKHVHLGLNSDFLLFDLGSNIWDTFEGHLWIEEFQFFEELVLILSQFNIHDEL